MINQYDLEFFDNLLEKFQKDYDDCFSRCKDAEVKLDMVKKIRQDFIANMPKLKVKKNNDDSKSKSIRGVFNKKELSNKLMDILTYRNGDPIDALSLTLLIKDWRPDDSETVSDRSLKDMISSILKKMEKEGKIYRKKDGRVFVYSILEFESIDGSVAESDNNNNSDDLDSDDGFGKMEDMFRAIVK